MNISEQNANLSKKLIFILDCDLRFTFFNKAWLDYRGTTLEAELKRSAADFVHTDDICTFKLKLESLEHNREPAIIEFRLIDGANEYKWMIAAVTAVFENDGSVSGYAGYCTDITGRKLAEESKQRCVGIIPPANSGFTRSKACYSQCRDYVACLENDISDRERIERELQNAYSDMQAVLDEISAPICVVGVEKSVIFGCNTAFAALCAAGDWRFLIGSPMKSYFTGTQDESVDMLMQKLHDCENFKCAMQRLDGTTIDIEVMARQIKYKRQDALVVHCIDLTRQKLQEQALRDAVIAAEEVSRMKTSFLANMSHEIRTPMNGVIGFIELALDDPGLTDKARDYLNKIQVSANGLLNIINAVIDISKIEAGQIELENTPFNLHDIFKHCETIAAINAAEKGVQLYFYAEPFIARKLVGDPAKLRQVLLNLLSNAIKFTHNGIVKLIAIVESSDESTVSIRFEVRDSGIGMTAEQIKTIFEPFNQADSSATRRYGGTGLGLAITKSIVELMGGVIKVESALEIGSKFSFTLTFNLLEDTTENTKLVEYLSDRRDKPVFSANILVCEDNSINQQVIKEHLRKVGIIPDIADNGKIGVEMVAESMKSLNPYDIIFMDIHMPVMDGIEAAGKLREAGVQIPIVALTANTMARDKENYLRCGMSDYIGKPFNTQELWECLFKFLPPSKVSMVRDKKQPDISQPPLAVAYPRDAQAHSKSAVINRLTGIERTAGDEKLYLQIQNNFLKENKDVFERLSDAIDSGDQKLAYRIAHTLKSVSAMIGADGLSKAAYVVEELLSGEESSILVIESSMADLKLWLDAVMRELEIILPERIEVRKPVNAENPKELDIEQAMLLVERLVPLLQSGDSKVEDMVDEIRSRFWPAGEKCGMFITQIEDYEFEDAAETLKSIRQSLEVRDER